jgi:hypothetical protein
LADRECSRDQHAEQRFDAFVPDGPGCVDAKIHHSGQSRTQHGTPDPDVSAAKKSSQ